MASTLVPPRPSILDGPAPQRPRTSTAVGDDAQLLAAYVDGDERAFDALLDRHARTVYATCYRYFRHRQDAEDATQETFIRLARHAATVRGTAKLSTWLCRVASNVCHDIARQRARRPPVSREEVPQVAEASDPVAYRETELVLHAALAQLSVTSRSALLLVAVEDRSYADAAAILGVSVPALKSRIHRARAQLAEIITDQVPSEAPDVPAALASEDPRRRGTDEGLSR